MHTIVHSVCCRSLVAGALLCLTTSGCAMGLIYANIREPFVTNMRHTPYSVTQGSSSTSSVKLPATNLNLSAEWNTRAIGDAAKRGGLSEIYYADLHTVSVLLGLWRRRTIEVYGKGEDSAAQQAETKSGPEGKHVTLPVTEALLNK